MDAIKAKLKDWWNEKIVKGFYKSWTWLASVFALLVTYGPDVANLLLDHMDLVSDSIPTLPQAWKSTILLAAHIFIFFARAVKQKSLEQPKVPVAVVKVPDTIDVPTSMSGGSIPVQTEVVMEDSKESRT